MKRISFLLLSVGVMFSSCDKEEKNQIQISSQEAATYIATSLSNQNGGLQTIFTDVSILVDEVSASYTGGRTAAACGASDTFTFNHASQEGESPAYTFNYDYGWTMSCGETQQPSLLEINLDYSGNMESPDFSITYEGISDFTVTGIMEDAITVNGGHSQTAAFDLTTQNDHYTGSHTFAYALTDIVIGKQTRSVQSGTATVLLTGATNKGNYAINASIVYNGDGTATITINGDAYGIDLSTGTLIG